MEENKPYIIAPLILLSLAFALSGVSPKKDLKRNCGTSPYELRDSHYPLRTVDFTNSSGEKIIFYDIGTKGLDRVIIENKISSRTLEKGDKEFEVYEQIYNRLNFPTKEDIQRKSWFR